MNLLPLALAMLLVFSFPAMARHEARIMAENIQTQIQLAYDMSLKKHGDSQKAANEIKEAIIRDLELADPEFKQELLELATKTLSDLVSGGIANDADLNTIKLSFLNKKTKLTSPLKAKITYASRPGDGDGHIPTAASALSATKMEYVNKDELLKNLVSDDENTRWAARAGMVISSAHSSIRETDVSYQLKIEFLGASIEAGPRIRFKREYSGQVSVMAEDLNPVLLADGNFDSFKRDKQGKIILKNGKPQRRFLFFTCSTELKFTDDYRGQGGFKVIGTGLYSSVSDTYTNQVTMHSRRILVPDYVGGKSMTFDGLTRLCQHDFLQAKLNDTLTVSESLNIMMKNILASVHFSHPKTKCAVDIHCIDWFNNDLVSIWKYGTYPRCFEESREKYRSCELRGLEGMSCRVIKDGQLISSGTWEVDCDKNLKCVQYQEASWMRKAKGKCRPIDPATYRDPRKYPEYETIDDLIEVEL